jgi:hypothetical protein
MKITLQAKEGLLHLGDDVLVHRYDAGDCDTIPWPFSSHEDRSNLFAALYGAVNTGSLPDGCEVALPDGTLFGMADGIHFMMPLSEGAA